jgi:hypothetical protein
MYSAERYLKFEPDWVVEMEERYYRLFPFRRYPVTHLKFRDGKAYFAAGHIAAQIKAAQTQHNTSDGNGE